MISYCRMNKLKAAVHIRATALENAMSDFGPSSQHFLMNSVHAPWQRAVSSTGHLPYYIKQVLREYFFCRNLPVIRCSTKFCNLQ